MSSVHEAHTFPTQALKSSPPLDHDTKSASSLKSDITSHCVYISSIFAK